MADLGISNVEKVYGTNKVLHGINALIRDQEFTVLLGESGCGKTTLLRMIAGLEHITGGTISIDGKRINDVSVADRGCAMVFQNYALYPHMSVFNNIAYSLKIAKMKKQIIREKVVAVAKILGMGEYLERKPNELSGGQRQRVALGRAIVRDPSIILYDEPLSNLDAKLRVIMRLELRKIHERIGATSIFVTHDQMEAMTLADSIIVMNKGQIEQVGTPREIYNQPASIFIANFIGNPPMNLIYKDFLSCNPNLRQQVQTLSFAKRIEQIGIRAEDLVLSQTKGIPVQVETVEDLGPVRLFYCNSHGHKFTVSTNYQEIPKLLFAQFPADKINYFDSKGLRLC